MRNEHTPIMTSDKRLFPTAYLYEQSLTFSTKPGKTRFLGDVESKSIREASCRSNG